MLTVNINSIKNNSELFETEIEGTYFNLDKETFFNDPVKISVCIYRIGEQVIIKGKASTQVQLNCSLCLNDFRLPLETELMFVAVPAEHYQAMNSKEDREMEPDDPVIIPCYDNQLDLIPEIQGVLLLALPVKPICKKDCRGLCSGCGVSLDGELCKCSDTESNSPFKDLEKILDQE